MFVAAVRPSTDWDEYENPTCGTSPPGVGGRRSGYDHLMLNLHDCAKEDMKYQQECDQRVVEFAPGTTWLCFSDQVMHAAVSGQYMIEQTINLPVSALYDPQRAPLAILERLTGKKLAA